jgi:hypothetical protein
MGINKTKKVIWKDFRKSNDLWVVQKGKLTTYIKVFFVN